MNQYKNSKGLILNSPYRTPTAHWEFVEKGKSFNQINRRREAGYMVADQGAKSYQDRGKFVPLPVVNQIRQRVDGWRAAGYPGITGITKTLLEHWRDDEQRDFPFFFCQIEAIETLIWFVETPQAEKVGIDIVGDGGAYQRLCCKLATGTGKTVVMAMLIAWQAINRATYPRDGRFSQNIFIVAPNLTVRERLAVLLPEDPANYYDEFGIVPLSLREKLRRTNVLIRNWHILNWESEEQIKKKRGIDKRGAKSDRAYTREVLGEMANAHNLVVINDEAHHAWRVPAGAKIKGVEKAEVDEATKWIGGLDRLHKTCGILSCFDFSATPFAPSGRKLSGRNVDEEGLFPWIISDFGLTDAVESGIVKTPRIVVRDDALPDAKTYKSRLYHIYNDDEVRDDFNRKANAHEPLPKLVTNAYTLLGADWRKTKAQWEKHGKSTPPVMITVANRTETAARIKHAFDHNNIPIDSLCEPDGILHIDSTVLKKAEAREVESHVADETDAQNKRKRTQKEQGDFLRTEVNTVGQEKKPGEQKQNIISVGMLSEGWDARTVTHIMGLRAFTSQLLCEQVVGRGLRRESYEINEESGLFNAEYVNVFGVPFSFLPHEGPGESPPPQPPRIIIQPVGEKKKFAIKWPNVIRIDRTYKPKLSVEWNKVNPLTLDTETTVAIAEIAPTVNNTPDVSNISDIDLEKLIKEFRRQKMIFKAAQTVWQEMKPNWRASAPLLMAELVRLAEAFLDSDRIEIIPALFNQDPKRRQLVITLNMQSIIRHFWQAIEFNNTEQTALVLDDNRPICATGDMRPWHTGKPCASAQKSHINYSVYDSTWESSESFVLDRNDAVAAWVKNDHLGFDVLYVYNGVVRKYRPDFLVCMKSGKMLVLETKGQQTEADNAKHAQMEMWTTAVNENGGFGEWVFKVSWHASDINDILAECAAN